MKIFMSPMSSDLGIGRVVTAYRKHLPSFGVEFVAAEAEADLIVVHAADHASRQTDILHCHGLYPTALEDKGCSECFNTNAAVVDNLRHALYTTVPSNWVAQILQRDMNIQPIVMPHGIDLVDWTYKPNVDQPYVLWAKGHTPGVVDVALVNQLAERLPSVQFVTTYGQPSANVKVIGKQKFESMKSWLQGAAVYLALTKETFGIQTLEAMACGVPVVGLNAGATPEIVPHGQAGYLTKPNDLDGMVYGIQWALQHQKALRPNARNVAEGYDWVNVAQVLYKLYMLAHIAKQKEDEQTYSIIIPCHNYANVLPNAIQSARQQQGVSEIIVVDDASTDGIEKLFAQYKDIKFIHLAKNMGVAQARNIGVQSAKGAFITCLDADDVLLPNFAQDLLPAIKADRGLGIVYGGMIIARNGQQALCDWPTAFDYHVQAFSQHNCIPSANIFRKAAWERANGYHTIYQPAEDAELWLNITSLGYNAAKVTDKAVYIYHNHAGSLSATHRQPDYKADKPWHKDMSLVPLAAPGGKPSWPVRNYDRPWVSIIIPVADYHAGIAWRAIESVAKQSMPYWEVIVVNASGLVLTNPFTNLPLEQAYRFVKQIQVEPGANPSVARNAGAKVANTDLLVFLDADDQLSQHYLRAVLNEYNAQAGQAYIYTDWFNQAGEIVKASDYDCEHMKLESIHPVTALVPKAWHNAVGGFDETLAGWEDWDYYLRLAKDCCGLHLPQALLTYDYDAGKRRYASLDKRDQLLPIIRERYKTMACGSCGGKRVKSSVPTSDTLTSQISHLNRGVPSMVQNNQQNESALVNVMINDGNRGMHTIVGLRTRIDYGMYQHGAIIQMRIEDQRAQPQWYVIQQQVAQAQPEFVMPTEPVVKFTQPTVIEPTAPLTVAKPEVPAAPEEIVVQDEGIDISLLALSAIRNLDWDAETAAQAMEIEREGKQRQSVMNFFETIVNRQKASA